MENIKHILWMDRRKHKNQGGHMDRCHGNVGRQSLRSQITPEGEASTIIVERVLLFKKKKKFKRDISNRTLKINASSP